MHERRAGRRAGPDRRSRPVAAGGWRRAVLGVGVGLCAGALVGLVLPREGPGPRSGVLEGPGVGLR